MPKFIFKAKLRTTGRCKAGHLYTKNSVYYRAKKKVRYCRICMTIMQMEFSKRNEERRQCQ